MDVAAGGVAEQAFGGMVGRLRRGAGLALDIKDGEIDRAAEVSLHVQHVAAFADPVSQEGLEARAVGPDLPDLPRLDG